MKQLEIEKLRSLCREEMWKNICENKREINFPEALIPEIQDDLSWILCLYEKILNKKTDANDDGVKHWMTKLNEKLPRKTIEDYFRRVATEHNSKYLQNHRTIFDLLDLTSPRKRVLLVLKESIGDIIIATSLLKSFAAQYTKEEFDLYFATDPIHFDVLEGNPYIYKVIPYCAEFESERWSTLTPNAPFSVYVNLGIMTQRLENYHTNNNLALNLNS